jgi:tetratricopeptide (TPR) repeat protein
MNLKTNKILFFNLLHFGFSLMIIFLLYSCSTTEIQQGEVKQEDILKLENTVKNDSLNIEALKKLSILLVRAHQNEKAKYYLTKALYHLPDDDALLFHQGLNFEFLNDTLSAINYYSRYKDTPVLSPYRKLMEGRYLLLNRDLVYKDIKNIVEEEKSLKITNIPSNTLAVFPLTYNGSDNKYAPLSRGLSEMLSIDLAKVKMLTVLERIRLKAILDELKFGQSALVDKNTAPRMGKLLSASLLYSGSFDITDGSDLKMDINSWNIKKNKMGNWLDKSGKLDDIFLLEKDLVFEIIDQLGINLTQQEKEQIQYIPTKNINAFLEYSKGLEAEDNGQYDAAAAYYQNAVDIDPDFKEASAKGEVTSDISSMQGNTEEILGKTEELGVSKTEISSGNENIIQNRLDLLGGDIRSSFDQRIEKRAAPQEAATTNGIEELPPPPSPPGK